MVNTKHVNDGLKFFLQSGLNSHKAAEYIGVAEYTLRRSRTAGILLGKEAPSYRKMGRKVIYELETLQNWRNQFEPQTNTAQNANRGER